MAIEVKFKILKDPVSWATHFAGMLASVVGLVLLVAQSAGSAPKVTAMAIYGLSLVTLFGASAIYHFLDLGPSGNRWLRKLDHCAIFLLIAGTYVPTTMHLLDGAWRLSILSVVGSLAIARMIFKFLWIDCPDWLGAAIYIGLGFIAIIPAPLMFPQLDPLALTLLLGGSVAYLVGAVVYVSKWPDPWPSVVGHHEIWHLFVLAGAAGHFLFTWELLDRVVPAF